MFFLMIQFKVEAWSAIAPSLMNKDDWNDWLAKPDDIASSLGKIPLKQVPPLLRRRFNELGKCAMAAVFHIIEEDEKIASIFASRHGDTTLTLSLLENMGKDEPMSPTDFSLAVHNAVGGLYSIARKDTSAVTAIAAMDGLILNTLFEAIGQLSDAERVLCVIYDTPLPELYQPYSSAESFPFALAMVLGGSKGSTYALDKNNTDSECTMPEIISFIGLLADTAPKINIKSNGVAWSVSKVDC